MAEIKHIDNFEIIVNMLNFDEPDSFYLVQILKRKKENPDLNVNARTINLYYIHSKEDLMGLKERIIYDCEHNNARAYINLNRLDAYLVALYTQKITAELMIGGQFYAVKNAYATACGKLNSDEDIEQENKKMSRFGVTNGEKIWVIDIDVIVDGKVDETQLELSDKIIQTIGELHKENNKKNLNFIGKLPTKNGHHIITNPFNRKKFDAKFPSITCYTNSPTILYV